MTTNTISNELKTERVITIIEPHHDDFWLNCSGTMLMKDMLLEVDKIKILSVFGISEGVSNTSTSIHKKWFTCKVEVKELWLKTLFDRWTPEEKAQYKKGGGTLLTKYEEINGKYDDLVAEIDSFTEGTLIIPAGYSSAEHNLLSRYKGDYYYREFPYYWQTETRRKKYSQGLWEEDKYEWVSQVKLTNEIWNIKWKIFGVVYKDVMGFFSPMVTRPYYKNVRDEVFMKKVRSNG